MKVSLSGFARAARENVPIWRVAPQVAAGCRRRRPHARSAAVRAGFQLTAVAEGGEGKTKAPGSASVELIAIVYPNGECGVT